MRSRSSTISSISSCASSVKSATQNADDPMAAIVKEIVDEFVLKLYHDGLLRNDRLIEKSRVWREFKMFDKAKEYAEFFASKNIGTLLRKHNYLLNTERGCGLYCIRMKDLFANHNAKIKALDELQINGCTSAMDKLNLTDLENIAEAAIEEKFEISPDAVEFPVIFKGGFEQKIQPDFSVTFSGCYICQENFKLQSDYEEHVEFHGFESDFAFLSSPGKRCKNNFEMIYRLVNKSHNFYFTMKTDKRDIIIEKIILIKTNIMHYIKPNLLPYEIPSDGIDSFLIDSHLFTIGAEQPIVVVYRDKSDKTTRFVEEHHFLRTEEFPQVHFNTRSCRLRADSLLKDKFKLGEYENELKKMKTMLKEKNVSPETLSSLSTTFRDFITFNELNERNAYDVLMTLNQIEDVCSQNGYSQLTQQAAKIKRFGQEYSVKLQKMPKGVFLENILSPLDEIFLIASEDLEKEKYIQEPTNRAGRPKKPKVYRAIVERIYYNSVCFKYDGRPICDKKTYQVTFRPSRLGLRYQYRALNIFCNSNALKRYLFPCGNNFENSVPDREFELFNPSIKTNTEQMQAVQNIVGGLTSFAPYIIFGPPGTGKTSTIVEAVLQLWKERPETRILITAGSNAACDEVAIRLCRVLTTLQPGEPNILRIYSKSNEKRLDSIDEILLECSNFYRFHFYPSVEVIKEFRIVVCTLSIVGRLVSGGIGNDFFSHVFIDECAASTEPESLIAITGTFSMKTRLILAGDHKQLGPVLKSSVANDLGLKISLMERLLNLDCYSVSSNGDYDRSLQSRLVKNFRSHSKIVDLFSTLYYGGTLKPMVENETVDLCSDWYKTPNREYPIIFHAVYGSSLKKGGSLSLSNEREIEIVLDYVKNLMYWGIKGRKISETDIGIISPYKKQYMRIQEELNRRRWFQIEVGAVETFQGKEKQIIIVSNVRSFTKTLGFLDNPRRLNVILSRAQSLLIMIGNPKTLSQNDDFKYIIKECRRNNSAIGSYRDIEGMESGEDIAAKTPSTNDLNNNTPCLDDNQKSTNPQNQNNKRPNQKKRKRFHAPRSRTKGSSNTNSTPIVNNLHAKKISKEANGINIDVCKFQNNLSRIKLEEKQNNVRPLNKPLFSTNQDMNEFEKRFEQLSTRSENKQLYQKMELEKISLTNASNHNEHMSKTKSFLSPVQNGHVNSSTAQLASLSKQTPTPVGNYKAQSTLTAYPASQPSYHSLSHPVSSNRINSNSAFPWNNNPSALSFNSNHYNTISHEKTYEKIVPLSPLKSKPKKESKCVLC